MPKYVKAKKGFPKKLVGTLKRKSRAVPSKRLDDQRSRRDRRVQQAEPVIFNEGHSPGDYYKRADGSIIADQRSGMRIRQGLIDRRKKDIRRPEGERRKVVVDLRKTTEGRRKRERRKSTAESQHLKFDAKTGQNLFRRKTGESPDTREKARRKTKLKGRRSTD